MIIYKVTNKINNKIYIGQTSKQLKERQNSHIWSANNDSSCHFHKAIRKYGINSFIWEIEDICNSVEELNEKEIFYIKKYETLNKGYNMTLGGSGVSGYKLSNERKLAIGELSKNRRYKRTNEYKENMSKIMKGKGKGRKNHNRLPLSQDYKDNMASALGGKLFYVLKDNSVIGEFNNQATCAKDLNLDRTLINHCLNGKRQTHKGYVFKYIESRT